MNTFVKALVACAMISVALPAFAADGSPWLPVPQSLDVSVSLVNQEATQFYRGDTHANLPFGKFTQDTRWVDLVYGVTDKTAVDFQIGNSDVDAMAAGSADARMDTTIGITRSLLDELETGGFSLALRVAGTIAGDYETGGSPASPGDGANSLSTTLHVGKFLSDRFAVAADGGIRFSNNEVPTEWNFKAGAHYLVTNNLGVYAQYQRQISTGDLDIGGPGFAGRFPEVAEEASRFRFGANAYVGPVRVDLSWFKVLDGRNTADFDIFAVSFAYTFDLYNP